MNPLDRLLRDEMTRLLDRIASSAPAGGLAGAMASQPTLRLRVDETEDRLSGLRAKLLEGYGAWGRALDDLENLWALMECRREAAHDNGLAERCDEVGVDALAA